MRFIFRLWLPLAGFSARFGRFCTAANTPQVPAGIAHRGPRQGAVAGGDFEAGPVQAQCAVAAPLGAHGLDAEGLPQGLAAGALAPGLGAVDEAVERRAAGLRAPLRGFFFGWWTVTFASSCPWKPVSR